MSYAPPANDAAKVFRSLGTILVFCTLWPIFLAIPFVGADIVHLPAKILGLLLGGPVILFMVVFGFIFGTFMPALATGCFSALVSPSIRGTGRFVAASTLIGTVASMLTLAVAGFSTFWTVKGLTFVANGALASLCCALLVCLFRSRPSLLATAQGQSSIQD